MRHVLLFLLGLIILTGCSSEDEANIMSLPPTSEVTTESSTVYTRAFPDSIIIALDNSMILQDLNAFNDSIILNTIQPRISWGWLKKLVKVAAADLYCFAGGMLLGSVLTASPVGGAVVGVVSGVGGSAAAFHDNFPDQNFKKIPTTFSTQFSTFDRHTGIMLADQDFNTKYAIELNSVNNISSYGNLKSYLKYGIHHNLALEQFRNSNESSDAPIVRNAIPVEYRGAIYSIQTMSLLEQDRLDSTEGKLNWDYIFSDRTKTHLTMTISQAKAAAIAKQFEELINNLAPDPDIFSEYTLHYMNSINNSQEIDQSEKTALLTILPVYMYSLSYWQRNLQEE